MRGFPARSAAAAPQDLRLSAALSRDQGRLRRLHAELRRRPEDAGLRERFEARLAASVAACEQRRAALPAVDFDPALPISREADHIIELIREHPVLVVAGETGSGKTTQLPKMCLAAGRGTAGLIGCTQPRRIAARAVAQRVAEELGTELGTAVGYQVRFAERYSESGYIKFMTDGILLAEVQSDPWLSAYDTIILDEAHERSLNIDFLLGYLKTLLRKRRDLKLVITSATIDTARFAAHFDDAPVVSIEGRGFPVEVRYRPLEGGPDDPGLAGTGSAPGAVSKSSGRTATPRGRGRDDGLGVYDGIARAVDEATREDPRSDVLVFLPGEREIRDVHRVLERRKYRETEILPLYARLAARDQGRVFRPGPRRRIVLATNVAETSLTVPRIRFVVDPGLARVKRYSPRSKIERLHVEPISQASADQRAGRCGRVAPGVCFRLYSEADFEARPRFTDPEIRRTSLAGTILRMLAQRLGKIEDFPFLELPEPRAIADGWQQLVELGAVDRERRLTAVGRGMARWPVDVALARMLLAAREHGVLRQLLAIAAFLGVQDPRERPADQHQAADEAHRSFAHPHSEFVGILRLWDAYREAHQAMTQSRLRSWCEERFLGFLRMREWRELHRQLLVLCREQGWPLDAEDDGVATPPAIAKPSRQHRKRRRSAASQADTDAKPPLDSPDGTGNPFTHPDRITYERLHRALIAGLPTQVGQRNKAGIHEGPRGRRFEVFPGSTLSRQPPRWILCATLLDTRKVWGLTCARIEPDWLITELEHLLARSHFDPHWSRSQGRVIGHEQISLFGLVLAARRPVHWARLYPDEARDIFVRQALVPGEINLRADVIERNQAVLAQARDEEARLRRAGLVADEDWQARWYLDRIPAKVHGAAGFDAWYRRLPEEQKRGLQWRLAELLPAEGSDQERFPDYLALGDARLALHYHFEPGAEDDGVTLDVPLHLLDALDAARLEWLVPGLVEDKVTALIRNLPKAQRRNFVPAPEFARAFVQAWPKPSADSLRGELARFLARITGVSIDAPAFSEDGLEDYLRIRIRVLQASADGFEVLECSRSLQALRERHAGAARQAFATRVAEGVATEPLEDFPADPIPAQIEGPAGIPAFPALVDAGDAVRLQVFADAEEAAKAHPCGVRRLLELGLEPSLRKAARQLPISPKLGLLYATIESVQRLREDLVAGALASLAGTGLGEIRDPLAFRTHLEEIRRKLFPEAVQQLALAESILGTLADLRPRLEAPLMGWAAANLDDLRQQLDGLVYPGFLRETPAAVLQHYPRYLEAMKRRCERALRDPGRDQARMLELKPFLDALEAARQTPAFDTPAWQALRWQVEELRVSLFAQELGTAQPVSPKRLFRQLERLRTSP